jgi:acetyl esterase/lipase
MPLQMDPELLARLSRSGPIGEPGPPVGDVESRRKNLTAGMAAIAASRQPMSGIDRTDVVIAAGDGAELRLSWYTSATSDPPGSAVLYLHGGGFIVPLLPIYDDLMREYTKRSGVPMLLVDYRVAPEHPHPTPSTTATQRCAGSPTTPANSVWTRNALRSWGKARAVGSQPALR